MPRKCLFLAVLLLLSACATPPSGEDDPGAFPLELDGSYRGRYWVTHHDGTSEQVRQDGSVWMRFHEGNYEVRGDHKLLPPAGSGEYRIEGRELILVDTAVHTADFDWTLILKGRFDIDAGGEGLLRFTQRDLDRGRYHELELRYEGP